MSTSYLGFDHVQLSLPVDCEQDADRFYGDVLGFEVEEKPPVLAARGGRWYRAGSVRVHLGVDKEFRAAKRAHPALLVADLDELVDRLAAAGRSVEWDTNIPGVRRCYIEDPFGNRIELVASR